MRTMPQCQKIELRSIITVHTIDCNRRATEINEQEIQYKIAATTSRLKNTQKPSLFF